MNRKIISWYLLMILALTSCGHETQTVEVTHRVPSTIEVTRPNPTPTVTLAEELLATSEPDVTIQTDTFSFPMSPTYFDGLVLLSQYFTLLDQGAYHAAVSLYSSKLLGRNGFEAEVAYLEGDLAGVNIISIRPLPFVLAQNGRPMPETPENEIYFVTNTTVIHQGSAWQNEDGTPKPDSQNRVITLVQENGVWKIDEINTFSLLLHTK